MLKNGKSQAYSLIPARVWLHEINSGLACKTTFILCLWTTLNHRLAYTVLPPHFIVSQITRHISYFCAFGGGGTSLGIKL